MSYNASADFWTINVSDVASVLRDRDKYVGLVKENGGVAHNMRDFKIDEFCVDNDGFEATWMRLPYQVEINEIGGTAFIRWYATAYIGDPLYEAPAYQGGVGTTCATTPANVTHRGAIVAL